LRAECESYSSRLNEPEAAIEENKNLTSERDRLVNELKLKDKYYEDVMSEINENHIRQTELDRKEIERLKMELNELRIEVNHPKKVSLAALGSTDDNRLRLENEQLRKQYEELKYSYDDLIEEKSQLSSSLNELKLQKQSDFEVNRLNLLLKVIILKTPFLHYVI
jgi:hypothetical protein